MYMYNVSFSQHLEILSKVAIQENLIYFKIRPQNDIGTTFRLVLEYYTLKIKCLTPILSPSSRFAYKLRISYHVNINGFFHFPVFPFMIEM